MRKGDMILVVSLSYLTPLLSIIIGSVYLEVGTGFYLWAGCLLVIVGSFICKLSVQEKSVNGDNSNISKCMPTDRGYSRGKVGVKIGRDLPPRGGSSTDS
jgi:hypothetical protein